MKLRGFKRTHIGCVRLIQQHGEFAEHGARLRHPGDLNAFLYDRDRALLKDQQPVFPRALAHYVMGSSLIPSPPACLHNRPVSL
jgi:hypothetical protein